MRLSDLSIKEWIFLSRRAEHEASTRFRDLADKIDEPARTFLKRLVEAHALDLDLIDRFDERIAMPPMLQLNRPAVDSIVKTHLPALFAQGEIATPDGALKFAEELERQLVRFFREISPYTTELVSQRFFEEMAGRTQHHLEDLRSPRMREENSTAPFPGIPTTIDGSGMAVWVETHISEVAGAYPITSSQTMAQGFQAEVANGRKNLWEQPLSFLEPESEHSAQSVCEGVALAGGRVTNFTSGQGLILMKEVLYVISGKRLPMVLHIGARALTSHALNVHCGHDDIMGVEDVGWGMVFARNVQDVGDLAIIARRVSESTGIPMMVVQDGFLTTHTLETCVLPEPDLMKDFVGDPRTTIQNLFDPDEPVMSGTVQNQDAYMKGKIAQRTFYARLAPELEKAMSDYGKLTGRRLAPVLTHKMEDAEVAIVSMGTMYETATVAADYLRSHRGIKAGAVHVTTFRPFPGAEIVRALANTKAFAVIERLDTPLAQSNMLTAQIKAAFADSGGKIPAIYSGSAGLGGRDVRLSDLLAAYESMLRGDENRYFVLGIEHPLAVTPMERPVVRPEGAFSLRGHSVGGWGSITTNKIIATIVGNLFGMNVQAYPKYGSEKKGLPTNYFLMLAKEPIRVHQELESVDMVALHDPSQLLGRNPYKGLRKGGWAYLQSSSRDPAEIAASLPPSVLAHLIDQEATLLAIDAVKIAGDLSPRKDLQQRMQGIVLLGVFLKVFPEAKGDVMAGIEKALRKYFGRRGEDVIDANLKAVRRGMDEVLVVKPEQLKVAGGTHVQH